MNWLAKATEEGIVYFSPTITQAWKTLTKGWKPKVGKRNTFYLQIYTDITLYGGDCFYMSFYLQKKKVRMVSPGNRYLWYILN